MSSFVASVFQRVIYKIKLLITLFKLDRASRLILREIRFRNLTYLSNQRLLQIMNSCKRIEELRIEGDFLEVGCALGGSSILIASVKNK